MSSHYTFNEKMPYPAEECYALVNDIKRYPEFLPGCTEARILHQEENKLSAKLVLQLGPTEYEVESHNTLTPSSKIHMHLGKTLFFKEARAAWIFSPIDENNTEVCFDLEITWKNPLSGKFFSKAIEKVAPKIIPFLLIEAKKRYGHSSI